MSGDHHLTVYLDHAATTPMRPEAYEAMVPWLTTSFGNPSGGHGVARAAARAVDEARELLASLVGCAPGELVFTSGGTESDNMAINGVSGVPVCSAIEHHAVLSCVSARGGRVIGVSSDGLVDLAALGSVSGGVVSVMLANNEVGTIQDLDAVADAIDGRAVLHTDAVQALPWLDVASLAARASLVSISAHKCGGPQGVGALIVRSGVSLTPMLRGGGQERERRSGTHNVAGIVGMAAAVQACVASRSSLVPSVAALTASLVGAVSGVGDVVLSAASAPRLPNIANLRIGGVEAEALLVLLDEAGVCASAGSSCASGAMEPSHVLAAMGVPRALSRTAVRFSLGYPSTSSEVASAASVISGAVARLRMAVAS
jgi:cysteine desulfurase